MIAYRSCANSKIFNTNCFLDKTVSRFRTLTRLIKTKKILQGFENLEGLIISLVENYFLAEVSFAPLCKIFSKIFNVIRYVGFTPVNPKPPEESVEPVSNGLSEA